MMKREREVVNQELLENEKCMNLMKGGHGGSQEKEKQRKWWESANKKRVEKIKNDQDFRKKWSEAASKRTKRLWKENKFDFSKEKNGFFRKQHDQETKKKIGEKNSFSQKGEKNSQFGKFWITNGLENLFVSKDDIIPSGWKRGRVMKKK